MQETKSPLWLSFDTANSSVEVLEGVVKTLKVSKERMQQAASKSYAVATDLAEKLVREKGLSFRQAHRLVGELVREAVKANRKMTDLEPETVKTLSKRLLGREIALSSEELRRAVDPKVSLQERRTVGSPTPREVEKMLRERKSRLIECREKLRSRLLRLEKSRSELMGIVRNSVQGS